MNVKMYSIYDCKEDSYTAPFYAKNNDVAVRMIKEQINQIPYPADKSLYYVGEFDLGLGSITDSKRSLVLDKLTFEEEKDSAEI